MKRETNVEGGMVGGASGLGPRPVRCKPTTTIIATRRREPAARQLFPPEAGSTPEQEHADHTEWLEDLQDAFIQTKEQHYGISFRKDPAEAIYPVPPAAATTDAAPRVVVAMMANNHDNSDAPSGLPVPEPLLFTTRATTSCEESRTDAATWLPSAASSPSSSPSTPSRRSSS